MVEAASSARLFAQAVEFFQAGRTSEAESLCQQILRGDPGRHETKHLLGVIEYQNGRLDTALDSIRAAIAADPLNPFYHNSLGVVLRARGALDEAARCHLMAIALKADYAEAHNNLGIVFRDQHLLADAARCHMAALAINPAFAEAHNNLGIVLMELGRLEEAVAAFDRVFAVNPDYAPAYDNRGNALRYQGKHGAAIESHRQAIGLNPGYIPAYTNLAASLLEVGFIDEAIENCNSALSRKPNCTEAYAYLSKAFHEKGLLRQGLECSRRALALAPNDPGIHFDHAFLLFCSGDLNGGWAEYEYRWFKQFDPVLRCSYNYPPWSGETLADKSILVWGEQGIGDEIMFASLYPELVAAARHCVFACSKKLLPLFRRSFPTAEVVTLDRSQRALLERGDDSAIDVQSAAGSLPRWLRQSVASFPQQPYLHADKDDVCRWKERLAKLGPQLKVGIAWRSSNLSANRSMYCTSLDQWGAVFAVPGVHFISLQYDECSAELADARQRFGVPIHAFPEVDLYNDIDQAAALTSAMDLVISAPSSAAILAAALGVPTWQLLLGFDWQAFGTEKNLFYPKMDTLHRRWDQDWTPILDALAARLQRIAEGAEG